MSVRNLKPVVYATKTSVKDNSEEDTQYFNKNQQDTYKKIDVKPAYVNLRNLRTKSVILDNEADRENLSTANNKLNNKTEQEKKVSFQTKIKKFFW
jgi:hypothetical protein